MFETPHDRTADPADTCARLIRDHLRTTPADAEVVDFRELEEQETTQPARQKWDGYIERRRASR